MGVAEEEGVKLQVRDGALKSVDDCVGVGTGGSD